MPPIQKKGLYYLIIFNILLHWKLKQELAWIFLKIIEIISLCIRVKFYWIQWNYAYRFLSFRIKIRKTWRYWSTLRESFLIRRNIKIIIDSRSDRLTRKTFIRQRRVSVGIEIVPILSLDQLKLNTVLHWPYIDNVILY